jgi:hypothetical protein
MNDSSGSGLKKLAVAQKSFSQPSLVTSAIPLESQRFEEIQLGLNRPAPKALNV